MELLKTKIALVAAAVTFASAVSAADVTITPTLEVSNALTLTQTAGTALNFGRIRALASAVADDCAALYIPANPANPATTTIPTTIGGTAFATPCDAATITAAISVLSPVADLTVASFEVSDAAPYTTLDITVDVSAPIASPDPTAADFDIVAVDVYRTASPSVTAGPVAMSTIAAGLSTGEISTGQFGSVNFNLGAVIATSLGSSAQYIDAAYTGSINIEVDY